MLTATECKRSAGLCDQLASEATDKLERAILERMAGQWRRLANHKNKIKSGQRNLALKVKRHVGEADDQQSHPDKPKPDIEIDAVHRSCATRRSRR